MFIDEALLTESLGNFSVYRFYAIVMCSFIRGPWFDIKKPISGSEACQDAQ